VKGVKVNVKISNLYFWLQNSG